ncbi:MAG: hypothetical protein ACHQ2Y_08370, partial [Candidatus Lutacidiplasmatales archaeon]
PPPPGYFFAGPGSTIPPGIPTAPGGWGAPSFTGPGPVIAAVSRVREAMGIYRWFLVITLLVGVVAVVTGSYYVASGGGFNLGSLVPQSGPNNTTLRPTSPGLSGASWAETALVSVFGLVGLILLLVSYLRWSSALDALQRVAYGASPGGYAAAERAKKDSKNALYVWIGGIIVSAILVGVIFLVIATTAIAQSGPGQVGFTPADLAQLRSEFVGALVAAAVLGAIVQSLVNFFASRSLGESLTLFGGPWPSAQFEAGRRGFLVGAVIAPVGLAALVSPYLAPLALAGPLLLLWGFHQMTLAYDGYLESPPVPGSLAPRLSR